MEAAPGRRARRPVQPRAATTSRWRQSTRSVDSLPGPSWAAEHSARSTTISTARGGGSSRAMRWWTPICAAWLPLLGCLQPKQSHGSLRAARCLGIDRQGFLQLWNWANDQRGGCKRIMLVEWRMRPLMEGEPWGGGLFSTCGAGASRNCRRSAAYILPSRCPVRQDYTMPAYAAMLSCESIILSQVETAWAQAGPSMGQHPPSSLEWAHPSAHLEVVEVGCRQS